VSNCCPLVDGSGGGGTPPTPTPGCENTILVQASDPFATLPAPVLGIISLQPDTLYKFCGDVDIGANVLELPPSSVIAGDDPLVDSVSGTLSRVVQMATGGTVKDIAVRNTGVSGAAILVGNSVFPVDAAVIFNVSVSAPDQGTRIQGTVAAITFARYLSQAARHSIEISSAESRTTVGAISVDQALLTAAVPDFRGIFVDATSTIGSFAFAQTLVTGFDASSIGVEIQTPLVSTIRAASCAFQGNGVSSEIAQPPPLASATFGSAVQSESVGCVGFQNSLQRGSATIENAPTFISGVGVFTPIGFPADSYTLDPSAIRISLVGATAPTQVLRFDRLAPYSGLIAVSVSVQVAVGLTFTPRVIRARVLLNGVPVGIPFSGTTPDFTTAAPVSLSFATPAELVGGDEVQLEIANATDAANLFVVVARITIT